MLPRAREILYSLFALFKRREGEDGKSKNLQPKYCNPNDYVDEIFSVRLYRAARRKILVLLNATLYDITIHKILSRKYQAHSDTRLYGSSTTWDGSLDIEKGRSVRTYTKK